MHDPVHNLVYLVQLHHCTVSIRRP